jgi:hypothetical protein
VLCELSGTVQPLLRGLAGGQLEPRHNSSQYEGVFHVWERRDAEERHFPAHMAYVKSRSSLRISPKFPPVAPAPRRGRRTLGDRHHGRLGAAVTATVLAAILACGCARSVPGPALDLGTASLPVSRSSHVVVIVMENEEASDVLAAGAAPYTASLARRYGLALASFAVTHPSLPNYLALTGGSTFGVTSDCTECSVRAPNIVDQLEDAGISWKAYLEGEPSPCFRGAGADGYAKKHNPFIYYDDVSMSPARCSHLVAFGQLSKDLRAGRLPTYVWISPNLCDDGHDCPLATGDRFLARTVPALLHELGPNGFLVLTWDEGLTDQGCCGGHAGGGHIVTIVAGPSVRPGARESHPVDHFGVLATIEQALGLAPLARASEASSGRLTSLFITAPHIR